MTKIHFYKTFKNHKELVRLLQSRGLFIQNQKFPKNWEMEPP